MAVRRGVAGASSNFAVDLVGAPDTRQDTWGTAASASWAVQFHPPAGFRVRILRISGDLIAFPKVLATDLPPAQWQAAGVSIAFMTTADSGSSHCSPCADNAMILRQGVIPRVERIEYAEDTASGGLLEPDHRLVVEVASWLNTFVVPIHLEPTFTVTYQFERTNQ
jgi:hypothetical protein